LLVPREPQLPVHGFIDFDGRLELIEQLHGAAISSKPIEDLISDVPRDEMRSPPMDTPTVLTLERQ
jgi:hypothetical protein